MSGESVEEKVPAVAVFLGSVLNAAYALVHLPADLAALIP